METKKGLTCGIYQDKSCGNCSNNGISAKYKEVTLIGENIPKIFEAEETRPAVYIENRKLSFGEYLTAYPIDKLEGKKSYMFGGCFIYLSDARFPAKYPIPLHDRLEERQEYDKYMD